MCLVQPGTVLFCTMDQNSKPREFHKPRKQGENQDSAKQFRGLYQHPQRAANYLVIEEPSALNVRALLTMCKAQSPPVSCSMVEFPGILVPAFKPTLSALQQMKNNGDLPLSQLLVPSAVDEEQQALVPPPSYTQKRGFRFNLKCLTNDQQDLFFTPGQPFDVKLLQKASSLDEAQARALVDSLSRSLGLMQGPPGTGKSYVGVALIRVLLANREAMRGAAKAGSKGMSRFYHRFRKAFHQLENVQEFWLFLFRNLPGFLHRLSKFEHFQKRRSCPNPVSPYLNTNSLNKWPMTLDPLSSSPTQIMHWISLENTYTTLESDRLCESDPNPNQWFSRTAYCATSREHSCAPNQRNAYCGSCTLNEKTLCCPNSKSWTLLMLSILPLR